MEPNEILNGEDHNSDAFVANKFSKNLNLNHTEVKITPNIITDYWNDTIKFMEEPRYSGIYQCIIIQINFFPKKHVVTMSGDIGDELTEVIQII